MNAKEYGAWMCEKVNHLLGNRDFKDRCFAASVEPTRRQARKFLRGEGRAYRTTRKSVGSPWVFA